MANDAGLWQGHGNSVLSETGVGQVEALRRRLNGYQPALVISSDLTRARYTANALGPGAEVDPGWKEMFLGEWEDATFEDVLERDPDTLRAIRAGEPIRFGRTGETLGEFEARIAEAFEQLVERLGPDDDAAVVTHGGAIDAMAARFLGRVPGRRAYPIATNTSLTELVRDDRGRWRLARFNDALHLEDDAGFLGRAPSEGYAVVGFVRHGVTSANMEGRIQGRMCWGLHDDGLEQARQLAARYPQPDVLFSSPQQRAMETASAFNVPILQDDRLMEMAFGEWEGKTDDEVAGDQRAQKVWLEGQDLPRGYSGETFEQVQERMAEFLASLDASPEKRALVVSHGGSIRAMLASIMDRGHDIQGDMRSLRNASVTHVALDTASVRQPGRMIIDIGVSPDLRTS